MNCMMFSNRNGKNIFETSVLKDMNVNMNFGREVGERDDGEKNSISVFGSFFDFKHFMLCYEK